MDKSQALTDHDEIKAWADKHDATPCVVDPEGKEATEILRFDMAADGPDPDLKPIEWDEFFRIFDDRELALLWDENSNFNKFVRRAGAPGE